MKEHYVERKLKRQEMEKLKEQVKKGSSGSSIFEEEGSENEDPLWDEDEGEVCIDHRLLVRTMRLIERRTMECKLDLTFFSGKMDLEGHILA